jgi:hypothetical protein
MLNIALVTAAAVLGAFLAPTVLAYRQTRAGATLPAAGHVAPRVIQNASIVYRLGLVALAPLLAWGICGELWPAVLYLLSVGLGLLLLYALRKPILQFLDDALVHDRSISVHEFIARRHGGDSRVRALSAALTVFAIYGLIVCVMIGLAIVLRPIFSGNGPLADIFIAGFFLLVAICTVFAGRLGILYATQVQLGLLYFGLFAATVLLLYLQGSSVGAMPLKAIVALLLIAMICAVLYFRRRARFIDTSIRANATGTARGRETVGVRLLVRLQKIFNTLVGILAMTLTVLATIVAALEFFLGDAPSIAQEGLEALGTGTSVSAMTLISLIVLPLLHPIVDVVSWQRLAAFARLRNREPVEDGQLTNGHLEDDAWIAAFKTYSVTYAVEVPLMALFVVLLGVLAGLTLTGTSIGDAASVFITSLLMQENSVATIIASLLMLGVLALAAATIGSLFAAGLCVVSRDIVPALRSRSAAGRGTDDKPATAPLIAAFALGCLVLVTFALADTGAPHTAGLAGLLGALLGFGSAQMALVTLVLVPLLAGPARCAALMPGWALAVLLIGAAIAVSTIVAGLVFGQVAALSWAVPAVFAATVVVFMIGALVGRQDASPARERD